MRLRTLAPFLALALFLLSRSASAQLGIYGKLDIADFSLAGSNTEHFESPAWFYGPGGGVYYDFLHFGPVSVGTDVRGDYQTLSSGFGRTDWLNSPQGGHQSNPL